MDIRFTLTTCGMVAAGCGTIRRAPGKCDHMTASSRLDLRDRAKCFDALEARRFDVVVIGGGVTGAGIARDAALRGLSVALVEARDFASGTSSRSSKMIHGGLRYLPQGHLKMVRETASERQVLRRIAPHLAKPQRYLIPAKSARSLAAMRAGLWLYERLGNVPRAERHEVLDVAELGRREPTMRTEGLRGAAEYTEFLTDDARLVLANARSAQADGATLVSYAEADGFIVESGRIAGITVRSTLPGDERQARVLARLVVSAAGVWVDHVRALEAGQRDTRLTLSRGIHIVVGRERLPVRNTVVLPTRDRRMAFAVPHGRFTYVGTTDVFHDRADYWPTFERADVDYLLEAVHAHLDVPPIADADIVALWSGIRPLVSEPGKKPGEVSRKDEIWTSPAGLVSIAGGKLSAYRAMAEHVVDLCVERLGDAARPCTTATEPLVGGERTLEADEIRRLSADGDAALRLVSLYGDEAPAIVSAGGDVAAEARHAVTHEGALALEDYWVRRSARAWFDDRAGLDSLEPAAQAMAPLLDWNDTERSRQVSACRALERDSRRPLQKAGG
jgi:glycerol-3-phosphate dehydrogenase